MTTYIYTLKCPETGDVRYVGKTNNPSERYSSHLNRDRDRGTYKYNWINYLRKKGLKPVIEIVKEVPTDEWRYWERYFIKYYKEQGYEITNHMGGGEGLDFGNQTSFKKGHIPWSVGGGYTTSKKGQQVPEHVKRKISNTLRGRFNTGNSKTIVQIDMSTGKVIKEYPSAAEAERVLGISQSNIVNVTNGCTKTAGGYGWRKI